MNFIIAHYWISTMVAVAIVGGVGIVDRQCQDKAKGKLPTTGKESKKQHGHESGWAAPPHPVAKTGLAFPLWGWWQWPIQGEGMNNKGQRLYFYQKL